jgi:hypothetical protein
VLYRDRLSHHPDDLATIVDAREALTRLLPARSPDVVKHLNNLGLSLLANPDLASEPDGSARDRDIPSCLLNRARDKPSRDAEGASDMRRLDGGARRTGVTDNWADSATATGLLPPSNVAAACSFRRRWRATGQIFVNWTSTAMTS